VFYDILYTAQRDTLQYYILFLSVTRFTILEIYSIFQTEKELTNRIDQVTELFKYD